MTQQSVPPPPSHSPITSEETNIEWKNWFSQLYDALERQGLVHYPAGIRPGQGSLYWNKITDPAWAHMAHTVNAAEIVVTNPNPITGWELNVIEDWQLVSDLANGTITFDQDTYDETGYYHMDFCGFAEGTQNTDYALQVFVNGVASNLIIPIVLKGNTTTSGFAWAGVVKIDSASTIDVRLTLGASLTLHSINWSMHRISPIAGS